VYKYIWLIIQQGLYMQLLVPMKDSRRCFSLKRKGLCSGLNDSTGNGLGSEGNKHQDLRLATVTIVRF
jgi:hypothetical protein